MDSENKKKFTLGLMTELLEEGCRGSEGLGLSCFTQLGGVVIQFCHLEKYFISYRFSYSSPSLKLLNS